MAEARVSWEQTWMGVADAVAKRSRCDGAQVGAVLVDASNRPVSTGYNGPPAGFDDSNGPTCSSWCYRQQVRSAGVLETAREVGHASAYGLSCPSVHAEANALMFADRKEYKYGTCYITAAVCADCAKLLANSGISRVVMRVRPEDAHRDPQASIQFLESCGLTVDTV